MTTRNASPSGYMQNADNRTRPPEVNTDLDDDLCDRLGLCLDELDALPLPLVENLRDWEISTAKLRTSVTGLVFGNARTLDKLVRIEREHNRLLEAARKVIAQWELGSPPQPGGTVARWLNYEDLAEAVIDLKYIVLEEEQAAFKARRLGKPIRL